MSRPTSLTPPHPVHATPDVPAAREDLPPRDAARRRTCAALSLLPVGAAAGPRPGAEGTLPTGLRNGWMLRRDDL